METIVDLIESSYRNYHEKTALRYKVDGVWQEISYQTLWKTSDDIAARLAATGFKAGDHAALLAPSSPEWIAAYIGIMKTGGIAIPIDKELKTTELRHILTDCEARVLFSETPYMEAILDMAERLPSLWQIIILRGSFQKTDDAAKVDENGEKSGNVYAGVDEDGIRNLAGQVNYLLEKQPPADAATQFNVSSDACSTSSSRTIPQWLTVSDLNGPVENLCPPLLRTADDTAVILYTSGTTGRSKGAMLTHANIVSNIRAAIKHFRLNDTIHTLSYLPINHVFEQVCGILIPLSLGGTVSFCESLKKLGDNVVEVKPTFFLGVPAVYRMILDRMMKNIKSAKLSRVLFYFSITRNLIKRKIRRRFGSGTIFVSGGAALDPAIISDFEKLGLTICQGYGITETSPVISAEQPDNRRLGSVGTTLSGIKLMIDRPNDEMVGEIIVKGPNVMQGYYRNPDATTEVLNDGWYRTGDLGRIDADGFLFICGRVKNLIVTPNGKNIYPEEVENELLRSPLITEVVVYGHKVNATTEEIHATIYPNMEVLDEYGKQLGKTLTPAEVERCIRAEVFAACEGLASYKRVKKFTIREDEFPKTTTRKIKRFEVEASISTQAG